MAWELGRLAEGAVSEGAAVIVAGDFNAPWRAHTLEPLRDLGFREAQLEAGRGPARTWPARGLLSLPPGIRIDHVAFSPGLECVEAWVGEATPSDHRPVFARFVLR